MVVYRDLFRGERVDIVFQVMRHGLPLDLSVAAYFTAFPGLLLIAQLWFTRMSRWLWRIYFALAASIYAVTFLLNLVLYRYWDFPLDTTPFYYFLSSPADALASVSGWCATSVVSVAAAFGLQRCTAVLCRLAHSSHARRAHRIGDEYRRGLFQYQHAAQSCGHQSRFQSVGKLFEAG